MHDSPLPRREIQLCLVLLMSIVNISSFGQGGPANANIHFYQLTTADGLTDNYIKSMTTDLNGYLWIGTGEGLNKFNGQNVERYFAAEYPALRSDNIREVVCDPENHLWVMSYSGDVTVIDKHRKFHSVHLQHGKANEQARWILQTQKQGIIIFTNAHFWVPSPPFDLTTVDSVGVSMFDTLAVHGSDSIFSQRFEWVEPHGDNTYLFATKTYLFVVDFSTGSVEQRIPCPQCKPLDTWTDGHELLYNGEDQVMQVMDLHTGKTYLPFQGLLDQRHQPIRGYVQDVLRIDQNQFYIATRDYGLYAYDVSTGQLIHHTHNASDPTTIVNDTPVSLAADKSGWVFVGANPNGISYFKHQDIIGQQVVFEDNKGMTYDGHINQLTRSGPETYLIGTSDYLIEWNRAHNTSTFFSFPLAGETSGFEKDEVLFVSIDALKHTWVATRHLGLYVLDERQRPVHHFLPTPDTTSNPLSGVITHIHPGLDGKVWIASSRGFCIIDPVHFTITYPAATPLKELEGRWINRIEFGRDQIWLCTSTKGAWTYHTTTTDIVRYTTKEGLPSNNIFTFNTDQRGNLYFGTSRGLAVRLTDGRTLTYGIENGLLNNRIEALLLDHQNRMWIGNDVGLACFNIADTTLRVFDERFGLSVQGFRINSYYQSPEDELFWGTERGVQYFMPDRLYREQVKLRAMIDRVESRDLNHFLTGSERVELAPGNNFITFHFSTIDYSKHLRTFYQYQLEGLDPEWRTAIDQDAITYNALPAGDYRFKVRASNDKKTWVDAENEISLHVQAPFYERGWFKLLSVLGLLSLAYAMFSYFHNRQKRKTEQLETEAVINYFASQINRHKITDEMLWDVAKNCISRLDLEECVIYLLDAERNVLIQKAAYGPKNPSARTILSPIEIPVGQGITGTVAKTMTAEIINNTEKDSRYIVDDERRYSEIAVPIIMDGQLAGVIDSEHHEKNFFTPKHLNLLTTIALLTANQLQRIRAEDEKQKAQIEVLQNKQKAAESRLQSLRLQMNPHFLFNALNSIQQMILANEDMVATKYLSRFSKLLRSILIHSDKESITLREEIDILKLYVELESVRFKDAFDYRIECDENLDTDEVKIPTLLIQPFVENAIWHGLMHKEGKRILKIRFTDEDHYVRCIIEDNGIGRKAAQAMKLTSGQDKNHTSKGIAVSLERLKSMTPSEGQHGSLEITDLTDDAGQTLGTRVEIHFPIHL